MKVIFSHGKESGPWGSKITRLAELAKDRGFTVDSIDYSDLMDPDLRVERLQSYLAQERDDYLLAGSSMGGYVSLVTAGEASIQKTAAKGVFLLAPALYIPGYQRQSYPYDGPVEIVHGWSDDIIPVEHSTRYAQASDNSLHVVAGDHRLNSSLAQVEPLFTAFLDRY